MALWIAYIQWSHHHGRRLTDTPLLRKMNTIENRDAILDLSDPAHPKEPEWPKVDFMVGNPPFLGGKLLRSQLGDEYVDQLFAAYDGRVRREADLCCYWLEKARRHIEEGKCRRAGLLATRLMENCGLSFMGDTKGGDFDVDAVTARTFLNQPNPSGRPSSDVVVPWVNGLDVTRRNRDAWIIDFGCDAGELVAAQYEGPFEYLRSKVMDARARSRTTRAEWWVHERPRPTMRAPLSGLSRFVATPTVAKHRLFVWISGPTLPDHQLIVLGRTDDFTFGALHSRFHQLWALAQGTQVRERESGFRYTPTTCFETFPFPEPTDVQRVAIAAAATELNRLRDNWLNPPEWTRDVVLTFPGSVDGPWAWYVRDPNPAGVGTVHYRRLVPVDDEAARELRRRTLTNLYNARPTWLEHAHRALDEAVAAAYGWPADLSDEEILDRVLALNLERARLEDPAGDLAEANTHPAEET